MEGFIFNGDIVRRRSDDEVYGRLGNGRDLQGVLIVENDLLRFKAWYRFGAWFIAAGGGGGPCFSSSF